MGSHNSAFTFFEITQIVYAMLPKIVIILILSILSLFMRSFPGQCDAVIESHVENHPSLSFIGIGDNGFELQVTDSDASTMLTFAPPLEISVTVGEREALILDEAGRDTLLLRVADELPIRGMIDAVSLPSHAPGVYPMVVWAVGEASGIEPLELQVQVGCTDPKYPTFMECIANCQTWELQW